MCHSFASPKDLKAIFTDEESQSSQDSQDEFKPITSTPRPHSDEKIHISLSRKTLFKESAEVATRCGISNRNHIALTAKIIKMGGGDLKDVTLSTSSAWRQRTEEVGEKAGHIKDAFVLTKQERVVVHWDGKIIKYDTGAEDERLCIKVTIDFMQH